MDYSEYKQKEEILHEKLRKIENEKRKLKNEYLKSLPFQVDDRITYAGVNYWVSAIDLPSYSSRLNIYVNPMKKDGTRSCTRRILYGVSVNEVEVIYKCGKL